MNGFSWSATRARRTLALLVLALAVAAWPTVADADVWSAVAPMAEPRVEQAATLLPNGEVLVAGGSTETRSGNGGSTRALALAELFAPTTRSWLPAASMRMPRLNPKAALLADGEVLLVGGVCPFLQYDPETETMTCESAPTGEAYDPASNTWRPIAPLPELQAAEALIASPDGDAILIGQFGATSSETSMGAALYDPGSDTWTALAKAPVQRYHAAATLMQNGDVLLAGGLHTERLAGLPVQERTATLDTVEEYDPQTEQWTPLPPMLHDRMGQATALLPNGSVLEAGGNGSFEGSGHHLGSDVLASVEIYDQGVDEWQEIAPMQLARTFQTATAFPDGDVLMVGGQECGARVCLGHGHPEEPASGDCCGASSAELYEASFGRWTFTEPMTSGVLHTATLLRNAEVLVTGGELPLGSGERPLSSAYVYGPGPIVESPPAEAAPSTPAPSQLSQGAESAPVPALKLSHLRERRRAWREPHGRYVSRGQRAAHRGTVFVLVLSRAAHVRFSFTRLRPGRRIDGGCRAPRRHRSSDRSCTRRTASGAFEINGHAGVNRHIFSGWVQGKLLPAGRYAVSVSARAGASHSATRALHFIIEPNRSEPSRSGLKRRSARRHPGTPGRLIR